MRRFKVSEEKIEAIQKEEVARSLFTERELAAFELADRMTESGHAVSDDLWVRLQEHYDHGQIVELACAIGLFNYFNRVNDTLRMEITK